MAGARRGLDALARKLAAVRDPTLHDAVLLGHLARTPPETLVEELRVLLREGNRAGMARLYQSFASVLLWGRDTPYDTTEAVYRVARELEADGVAFLFLDPPPHRIKSQWYGDPDPDLADRTLGERKSLARRPSRAMLERLLRVAEPEVVRILLANPRLTERDVVWMAARRPNRAPVLEEVARTQRWGGRARVRLAVVQNPYSPTRLAVLWCPLLSLPELRLVAGDGALHPLVREMARYLVSARTAFPAPVGARVIPFPEPRGGEE